MARSFRSLDIDAIGALAALHRLGLAVPDEVAVVAVDATRLSPYPVPALTFVRQPTELLVGQLPVDGHCPGIQSGSASGTGAL